MMKVCLSMVPAIWCCTFLLLSGIGVERPAGVGVRVADGQSIVSPFIMLCRRTCGGFGFFRRLCCMVDSLCCSKPDACPDDITADTLIPFCQTCTEDVDCLFRSKCCDSGDRKCCTAIRSIVLRNSFFTQQRAKDEKTEEAKKTVVEAENKDDEDVEESIPVLKLSDVWSNGTDETPDSSSIHNIHRHDDQAEELIEEKRSL